LHVLEIILAVAHYQSSLLDQDLLTMCTRKMLTSALRADVGYFGSGCRCLHPTSVDRLSKA